MNDLLKIGERPPADYQKPLVSICCLAYNHQDFIRDCFEGFLKQKTTFPVEILVHDDASTDSTAQLIRGYQEEYPLLVKPIYQRINQFSRGVKINWQFNYPRARGKYIAICEGDDFWVDSSKLERQVRFLEENPEYVIVYGDTQAFDEKGLLDVDFGGARRDLSALELQKGTPIFTLTVLFRNVLEAMPPEFNLAPYGDRAMWSLLGLSGKGHYLRDLKPCMYRVHDGGIHSKRSEIIRARMNQRTAFALMVFFERIGVHEVAKFYENRAYDGWRKSLGVDFRLFPLMRALTKALGWLRTAYRGIGSALGWVFRAGNKRAH